MQALSAHYLGDKPKALHYGQLAIDGNPLDLRLRKNQEFYNQGI
jgi:hypothetical protein